MYRRMVAVLAVGGMAAVLLAGSAAAETLVFSARNRAFAYALVAVNTVTGPLYRGEFPSTLGGQEEATVTIEQAVLPGADPLTVMVVLRSGGIFGGFVLFEVGQEWLGYWRRHFVQEMSKDLLRFDLIISEVFTRPLHVPVLILRGPEGLDNIHFFPSWMKIPPLTPHDPTLRGEWLSAVEQRGYRVHPFYKALYQVRE